MLDVEYIRISPTFAEGRETLRYHSFTAKTRVRFP